MYWLSVAEHLDIPEDHAALEDPVCTQTYHGLWRRVAQDNSNISDQFFPEMPSNRHTTLEQFNKCREMADIQLSRHYAPAQQHAPSQHQHLKDVKDQIKSSTHPDLASLDEAKQAIEKLQGHLFMFPLEFLHKDALAGNLKPVETDAEFAIPIATFL